MRGKKARLGQTAQTTFLNKTGYISFIWKSSFRAQGKEKKCFLEKAKKVVRKVKLRICQSYPQTHDHRKGKTKRFTQHLKAFQQNLFSSTKEHRFLM